MNREMKFAALGLTIVLFSMMSVATVSTVSASGSGYETHYAVSAVAGLDMTPGNPWNNINYIYSTQGGGNYASVAGNGENDIQYSYRVYIQFNGFSIPEGAGWVITGLVFKLGGYMVNGYDRTSSVGDYQIKIWILLHVEGSNSPQGTWPTSYTVRSYGSSSDKWGLGSQLTPQAINYGGGFTILYEARFIDGAYVPAALYANGAQVTVYYYQP